LCGELCRLQHEVWWRVRQGRGGGWVGITFLANRVRKALAARLPHDDVNLCGLARVHESHVEGRAQSPRRDRRLEATVTIKSFAHTHINDTDTSDRHVKKHLEYKSAAHATRGMVGSTTKNNSQGESVVWRVQQPVDGRLPRTHTLITYKRKICMVPTVDMRPYKLVANPNIFWQFMSPYLTPRSRKHADRGHSQISPHNEQRSHVHPRYLNEGVVFAYRVVRWRSVVIWKTWVMQLTMASCTHVYLGRREQQRQSGARHLQVNQRRSALCRPERTKGPHERNKRQNTFKLS